MQQLALSRADPREADFDSLIGPQFEAGFRTALATYRSPSASLSRAARRTDLPAWLALYASLAKGTSSQSFDRLGTPIPERASRAADPAGARL